MCQTTVSISVIHRSINSYVIFSVPTNGNYYQCLVTYIKNVQESIDIAQRVTLSSLGYTI